MKNHLFQSIATAFPSAYRFFSVYLVTLLASTQVANLFSQSFFYCEFNSHLFGCGCINTILCEGGDSLGWVTSANNALPNFDCFQCRLIPYGAMGSKATSMLSVLAYFFSLFYDS